MPWRHGASARFTMDQFDVTVDTRWLYMLTHAGQQQEVEDQHAGVAHDDDEMEALIASATDVKMQISIDNGKFTSSWITVFEREEPAKSSPGRYLSVLDVNLVHYEGQVRGMHVHPSYTNKLSQEEVLSKMGVQNHFHVHYHWSEASTVDEQAGLRLVFVLSFIGTLAALGASVRGLLKQV